MTPIASTSFTYTKSQVQELTHLLEINNFALSKALPAFFGKEPHSFDHLIRILQLMEKIKRISVGELNVWTFPGVPHNHQPETWVIEALLPDDSKTT